MFEILCFVASVTLIGLAWRVWRLVFMAAASLILNVAILGAIIAVPLGGYFYLAPLIHGLASPETSEEKALRIDLKYGLPSPPPSPKLGEVQMGYRYIGGNPASRESWQIVSASEPKWSIDRLPSAC